MDRNGIMRALKVAAVNVIGLFFLLEITLRLWPGLVPPLLLIHYEPDLRAHLARGNLPEVSETVLLPRDDGGFPLRLWKPNAEIDLPFEDPGIVPTVRMDEMGFCNRPGTYQRGQFDLITIGDSFTWCLNVRPEETWTARLVGTSGIPAYNLGKDGIGLYEYLQILKTYGLPKHPRYVVLNVYEGNDLRDAIKYQTYVSRFQNDLEGPRRAGIFDELYRFFDEGPVRRHSYAFNLIVATINHVRRTYTPRPDFTYALVTPDGFISFNPNNVDTDELKTAYMLVHDKVRLNVVDKALNDFFQLARIHRFIPIITYTPSAYTVYADHVRFKNPEFGEVLDAFSREQRTYFRAYVSRSGGHFIDLTSHLQKAAPEHLDPYHLLYFPTNLHLTQHGHQVIADTLKSYFASLNTPPIR